MANEDAAQFRAAALKSLEELKAICEEARTILREVKADRDKQKARDDDGD